MNKDFLLDYSNYLKEKYGNKEKYLLVGTIADNKKNNNVSIYYKDELNITDEDTLNEVDKFMLEVERLIDYLIVNNIEFNDISLFSSYGVFLDPEKKANDLMLVGEINNKLKSLEYNFFHLSTGYRGIVSEEYERLGNLAQTLINDGTITSHNDLIRINLSFSVNDDKGNPIDIYGIGTDNIVYDGIVKYDIFFNELAKRGIKYHLLDNTNEEPDIKDLLECAIIDFDSQLVSVIDFDQKRTVS